MIENRDRTVSGFQIPCDLQSVLHHILLGVIQGKRNFFFRGMNAAFNAICVTRKSELLFICHPLVCNLCDAHVNISEATVVALHISKPKEEKLYSRQTRPKSGFSTRQIKINKDFRMELLLRKRRAFFGCVYWFRLKFKN